MQFSIVTPSFRSGRWLKLCIASVADQEVEHEHIIQDSCSDDGTQEWLAKESRVKAFIEKDQGMYDAVNRGLRRAGGEILAYLNSDEQYLPGALSRVWEYFQKHPEVEIVFGDAVVIDTRGDYICQRQVCLPHKFHTWVGPSLAILTCATFFRRTLIDRHQLFFQPAYQSVGDAEWILRLLQRNIWMGLLKCYTSAFTETGVNLAMRPDSLRETKQFTQRAPRWVRLCGPWFTFHHRLRRLLAGHYWPEPISYSLFTEQSPAARITKQVSHPTYRWIR